MLLETLSTPYEWSHKTAFATDTSFPSKIPTRTRPSGNGVIDFMPGLRNPTNGIAPNYLRITPVGTGQDDAVLTGMRVIAWDPLPGTSFPDGNDTVWIPVILVEIAAVLCSATGVSGGTLLGTHFLADTITLVTGTANVSHEIVSPTGNVAAHIIVSVKGASMIEVTFDLGANMTGANSVIKRL